MSQPVIELAGVYKKFARRSDRHKHYLLADLLGEIVGIRRERHALREGEFWAVEDVSFSVGKGESVALVGRNGSGKSTVLKLVAGLLKPDAGSITVRGRMQSLLNLGTGFNARLSGRENIYNAAAVQGFRERETRAIEEAVVDFAELDEFIDNPVQSYSSGMRARLGFSVAVHLRPDILLLDEILAVGDFTFQNKCYLKIQQMRNQGLTSVVVSHSHARLMQSCTRAVWLEAGRVAGQGACRETVRQYVDFAEARAIERTRSKRGRSEETIYGIQHMEKDYITSFEVTLNNGNVPSPVLEADDPLTVRISVKLAHEVQALAMALILFRADGTRMALLSTRNHSVFEGPQAGDVSAAFEIGRIGFAPGSYRAVVSVNDGEALLMRQEACEFFVKGDSDHGLGLVRPPWRVERVVGEEAIRHALL
jgi:lipopolysaccharide transport system ATP-binding protein